jgi:hypothetical protein
MADFDAYLGLYPVGFIINAETEDDALTAARNQGADSVRERPLKAARPKPSMWIVDLEAEL